MTAISIIAAVGVVTLAVGAAMVFRRVRTQLQALRADNAAMAQQIRDQHDVLRATRTRLVKAEGRLDRQGGRLDRQSGRVAKLREDTSRSVAELRRGAPAARRFEVVEAELDKIKSNAAEARRANTDRNKRQDGVNVELRAGLRTNERGLNAMLLREARKGSRVDDATRLLLLITIHRSGSTTLFDVLRAHPDVFFEPTSHFWDAVGLRGRRYPLDLSDGPTAEVAVEVEPGLGALIPPSTGGAGRPTVAIEKAHPQFFDFDDVAFASQVTSLADRASYDFSIAYGVRAPLDAMWSMVDYKRRNPRWYHFLPIDEIPGFIADSIEAIMRLRERIPGPVIDYDDVVGPGTALRDLFVGLTDPKVDASVFDNARFDLSLDQRSSAQSGPFVGRVEREERLATGPDGAWADCARELARATDAYDKLLSR